MWYYKYYKHWNSIVNIRVINTGLNSVLWGTNCYNIVAIFNIALVLYILSMKFL